MQISDGKLIQSFISKLDTADLKAKTHVMTQ